MDRFHDCLTLDMQRSTKVEAMCGKTNPAYLPTRGQSIKNLIQSQLWWTGPTSLSSADEAESNDEDCVTDEVNTKLRSKFQVMVELTSTVQAEPLSVLVIK